MNSTKDNLIAESAVEAISAVLHACVKVVQLMWVVGLALYALAKPQLDEVRNSEKTVEVTNQLKVAFNKVKAKFQPEQETADYLDPAAVEPAQD